MLKRSKGVVLQRSDSRRNVKIRRNNNRGLSSRRPRVHPNVRSVKEGLSWCVRSSRKRRRKSRKLSSSRSKKLKSANIFYD